MTLFMVLQLAHISRDSNNHLHEPLSEFYSLCIMLAVTPIGSHRLGKRARYFGWDLKDYCARELAERGIRWYDTA